MHTNRTLLFAFIIAINDYCDDKCNTINTQPLHLYNQYLVIKTQPNDVFSEL